MSAPGPEAIPTSADPRSRRHLSNGNGTGKKPKRALSPTSAQAAHLSHLFAHADQEIRIPPSSTPAPRRPAPPPEIVTNVQGSSAGAGSGEFHVYKAARRREYERLRLMDDEVARERAARDFDAARRERETRDDEKTRRNREKRDRKKKMAVLKTRQQQQQQPAINTTSSDDVYKAATNSINTASEENPTTATPAGKREDSGAGTSQPKPLAATDGPGLLIHDDDD